ncbi:TolC family protein [Roseivirga sp. 4D4]|uniref:TolC family protein n=1 Tax=Roseivirga sp. 4D4 TaxID=1889784 RepID=UPI0009F5D2A2|nr:TolC family protein [Roseivirga sp. 4D4]
MKKKITFFSLVTILSLATVASYAQDLKVKSLDELLTENTADTTRILPLESFVDMVLLSHPVVKQANLLPENAKQEIRLARGAFDPKLESSWDVKNFDDKEYWDLFNTTLKVPTWFPVDPKVSFDRNKGQFVNPENSIPGSDDFQQVTAGLSLPIGRGLLIDQRRATVKQAELFAQITDAERIKMINKVLLSASKDYWEWYFAFYNYLLIEESLNISQNVYQRVLTDFEFGEAAAIDTVQAAITLQNRKVDRSEALIDFRKAGLMLSNYLWGQNEEPMVLQDNIVPQLDFGLNLLGSDISLDSLRLLAIQKHPELVKTNFKLDQLDIDRRLARENLKPRVDLNYNLINSPVNQQGEFVEVQLRNNYKFGIEFEFPLFLRKERSKLRQTEIKIEQTTYELSQLEREILNGIEASFFELDNTRGMLSLMQEAVNNYTILLDLELINLANGESDLFKINFQQDKLLESQIKLMKMRSAMEKARVTLYWSAGLPYLNFNLNGSN